MSSSAVWDVSSNWEDDAAAPWYDTDNEEVEEGGCSSPAEAGDIFVEQQLMLQYRGTLSAKSVCLGVLRQVKLVLLAQPKTKPSLNTRGKQRPIHCSSTFALSKVPLNMSTFSLGSHENASRSSFFSVGTVQSPTLHKSFR